MNGNKILKKIDDLSRKYKRMKNLRLAYVDLFSRFWLYPIKCSSYYVHITFLSCHLTFLNQHFSFWICWKNGRARIINYHPLYFVAILPWRSMLTFKYKLLIIIIVAVLIMTVIIRTPPSSFPSPLNISKQLSRANELLSTT